MKKTMIIAMTVIILGKGADFSYRNGQDRHYLF